MGSPRALWVLLLCPGVAVSQNANCRCGVSTANKIVGGVNALAQEFPWQAALVANGMTLPFCGGTLISSRTVLTAAHCSTNVAGFKVVLGGGDLSKPSANQKSFTPTSFVRHPSYSSTTLANDFATITLGSDVVFDGSISPVCLPADGGAVHENKVNTITGWGTLQSNGVQPNVLQKTNVTTMSNTACTTSPYLYKSTEILPNMICATAPGKDSCQGDSGGPMVGMASTGFNREIIGVVSWGYGCAQTGYPGVYSRVSTAKAWIQSQTTGTVCPAPTSQPTVPNPTATTTRPTTTRPTTTRPTTTTIRTTTKPICWWIFCFG